MQQHSKPKESTKIFEIHTFANQTLSILTWNVTLPLLSYSLVLLDKFFMSSNFNS
jgi:hypothetical protein